MFFLLAGKHGATPPHGTTHYPRHQETGEVSSRNQAPCSKTVRAVKRCSSLFRFGGVPCPARASRAAAKKFSTLRVVFFLRRPCRPPRYGAWNRRQHAPSVVTRGFSCAAPDPLFQRCAARIFSGGRSRRFCQGAPPCRLAGGGRQSGREGAASIVRLSAAFAFATLLPDALMQPLTLTSSVNAKQ